MPNFLRTTFCSIKGRFGSVKVLLAKVFFKNYEPWQDKKSKPIYKNY